MLIATLAGCTLPGDANAAPRLVVLDPTPTPTTATGDPTPTPTIVTDGATPTPTASEVAPPTFTPTPTSTSTPAPTPTATATPTPTPEPTPSPTLAPTPEPIRAGLSPGEVGVYLTVSLGSESDVLNAVAFGAQQEWLVPAGNIVVETSHRGVLMFVPATGEVIVLSTYSSPSYSPHVRRPYTTGDRLFVNTEWTDSGRLDFNEYDPQTSQVIATAPNADGGERSFTVHDNDIYYWTTVESLFNPNKTYLTRMDLTTRQSEYVAQTTGIGRLGWVAGSLYGITIPTSRFPTFSLSRMSPTDASSTEIDAYEITGLDSMVPGSFGDPVIDGDAGYWVSGTATATGTDIEIWSYGLRDRVPDIRIIAAFSIGTTLTSFIEFDADDGTFLANARGDGGKSLLVLYDLASDIASVHDVGLSIIDADLLKLSAS